MTAIDSSVVYGDDGSATITNANTIPRYFMFNTAGARITKGVTLCLSVMYKLNFRHRRVVPEPYV